MHFSHLEEDPLYIAYADMMAKVPFKAIIKLGKKAKCCKSSETFHRVCRAAQKTRRRKRKRVKKRPLRYAVTRGNWHMGIRSQAILVD